MMAGSRPLFDPERMTGVPTGPAVPRIMTISQLNQLVKQLLDDRLPGVIRVIGEISNLSRPNSGHLYLTLKDQGSELRCAMWRSAVRSLKFQPADGQEVIATGHVEMYVPRGQYQFNISKIEPRGTGSLELAFRQLRERLEKEGLFDQRRKKPIPRYPRRIALVTSPTGAALHDLLHTLQRRYPCLEVLLHPVRVQGEGAAEDVAAAIARLNSGVCGTIDVMIVGRGGGSLEDLWAFNEEKVARAIFASGIPVISAVGHEVDVTIADLVADLRAPTPTAAAELAVPLRSEVLDTLWKLRDRLRRAGRHQLDLQQSRINALARQRCMQDPLALLRSAEQGIDELAARLRLAAMDLIAIRRERLHRLLVRVTDLQPKHQLPSARRGIDDLSRRLNWAVTVSLKLNRDQVAQMSRRLGRAVPTTRLPLMRDNLKRLRFELDRATGRRLQFQHQRLEAITGRLQATSFHDTLARGFTITRRARDGRILTSADQVEPGEEIITQTADGRFTSRVIDDESGPASASSR